jgi:hypothetical protein
MSKVDIGKTQAYRTKQQGGNKVNNDRTQSNTILKFKPSKLNKTQISAVFKDADDNEVNKYINIFQEGDPKVNLVSLFKQLIDLGNLCDLWGSSMKTLCQIFARALSGKPRKKWSEIVKKQASFTDNNNNGKEFIKMCQTAASKILGLKAFRNQEAAMDDTMTLPNNKPFRNSIEQYFTMNKDMKYLGEEGESYSVCTLNKQIIKRCFLQEFGWNTL